MITHTVKIVITYCLISLLIGGSLGLYDMSTDFHSMTYSLRLITAILWLQPIPIGLVCGLVALWRL